MSAGSVGSLRRISGPWRKSQESVHEERCVDTQPTPEPKDANGKGSEIVGFIPGSAKPSSEAQTCNPCSPPRSCKTLVCSVITCGLYRVCQRSILAPCLAPDEDPPDEPEKVSLRAVNPGDNDEEVDADWSDFRINGVKVTSPKEYLDSDTKLPTRTPSSGVQTQPGYLPMHGSMRFDDWEDDEEDVDSLITKKLLELYSEYQIEELARCTSDSLFVKKSKAISQLINSLAEEHKMNEQEAECRLVRGIIRISTRRSTKKRPPLSRVEKTLSDSGNETMTASVSFPESNNNNRSDPDFQISDLTSSDKFAREIWRNNRGHSSSSPTEYSPTQTDSSGVPLIRSSVRT